MTQDEVIQWARDAGWTGIYSQWVSPTEREHLTVPVTMEQIEAFAKLAFEAGRQEWMKQERALWLLAETSKEIGEQL